MPITYHEIVHLDGAGLLYMIDNRGTNRRGKSEDAAHDDDAHADTPGAEVDVMELFRRRFGGDVAAQATPQQGQPMPGMRAVGAVAADGSQPFPSISMDAAAARYVPRGPMAPTPSGYVPGAPIMATALYFTLRRR